MKKILLNILLNLIFCIVFCSASKGQGTPDILYYKFDDTGRTVRNFATSPPTGASSGTLYGGLTQGSASGTCGGTALLGTGTISTTDYMDTKWKDSLVGRSWTVSFWTKNLDSTTALYYIFSDPTAGNFRCFMGGAAGAGNLFLRGPFTDVLLTGGSGKLPRVSTFVYDASAGNIYAYLNGNLINTVAQSSISIVSTGSLIVSGLGGSATYGGLNPNGVMDEFRFYGRALSASEVAKLKYSGNTSATVDQRVCGATSFKSPSGKYTWTTAGTYRDTIQSKGACDSFITFRLTFGKNTSSVINETVCDLYVSPSKKFYTKSGTYFDLIKNASGCDSNITINLTVKYSSAFLLTPKVCDKYVSPSGKYTWNTSGTYADTLPNKAGCDSLMTIKLTVNYKGSSVQTLTVCDSYKSPSGKKVWKISGTYRDTISTVAGCDSFITVNLTVKYSTSSSMNIKECERFKSPSGKHIWTKSGTYIDTIPNKKGCDSLISVVLTIDYNTTSIIVADGCEQYRSPSGKYLWTLTGAYNDTLKNTAGCDSFLTVDLRLHPKTSSIQYRTACVSFVSPSKKHIWIKSGKYFDTIPNRWGCDSIVTFNITINEVDINVTKNEPTLTANSFGAIYQWLDCNNNYAAIPGATNQTFTAKAVGSYAVKVTENSCSDTSICYSISKVGSVDKNQPGGHITVYPNPSDGIINILATKALANASVKLINLTGEVLMETVNVFGNNVTMDISKQATGIYFIEINEKGSLARIKVLKF